MKAAPLQVRMSYFEAICLKSTLEDINKIRITSSTSNDVIILMEFSEKFYQKLFNHALKSKEKAVKYTIPISVARALHSRLLRDTSQKWNEGLQSILNALDQQLVNLGIRPEFKKPSPAQVEDSSNQ